VKSIRLRDELREYFGKFSKGAIEQIYLVHGDYDQQQALQGMLNTMDYKNVGIPERGDEVEI
jgi:hypothetical protein